MSKNNPNKHPDISDDSLFEDEPVFDTQELQNVVKKAQRKSLLRTTLISIGVSAAVVLLLFTGYILIQNKLNEQGYNALASRERLQEISGPNTYITNAQFEPRLFRGDVEYTLVKRVETRIIPWGSENMEYSLWGTMSRRLGGYANTQMSETNGNTRVFNKQNGEWEMLFYHPSLSYNTLMNDFALLPNIREDKFVEMGLSFDKPYSLEEVKRLMPEGVHATWFWVNTMDMDAEVLAERQGDEQPMSADTIYGFDRYSEALIDMNPSQERTEEDFMNVVKTAIDQKDYYISEYQRIYNAVEKNKKDGLIIGAVVTGTKENLLTLKDKTFNRAAVLGAVIDQY